MLKKHFSSCDTFFQDFGMNKKIKGAALYIKYNVKYNYIKYGVRCPHVNVFPPIDNLSRGGVTITRRHLCECSDNGPVSEVQVCSSSFPSTTAWKNGVCKGMTLLKHLWLISTCDTCYLTIWFLLFCFLSHSLWQTFVGAVDPGAVAEHLESKNPLGWL